MLIPVDPRSSEPIFQQIVFQVRALVARGDLAPGDRLPSVRELARTASVNPNTVSRAYEVLEHEGVIVRRQGAGCYVREPDNQLLKRERNRQLRALVDRMVTNAFHLGCDAEEIRSATERCLAEIGLEGRRKS